MKHRKLLGVIALVLAIALSVGTVLSVGAANLVSDVDGDGKITAFDAQMIAESNAGKRILSDTQLSSIKGVSVRNILNYLFGTGTIDAGDTNSDGVQEIYTAAGLQLLQDYPEGSYILMQDLDLQGADWTPVAYFSGSFNGNGKTISNFTINTCIADAGTANVYNQGFFGDTAKGAQIYDLNLSDVTINAADEANSIGFFAGSLRGHLTNCTVIGTLNDSRETYPSNVYTGVMAGKINSGSEGSITGGTTLSITDEAGKYTTSGLCANVKLNVANDQLNIISGTANKVGLVGYAPAGYTVTGIFTDTTHSSDLLSETIQARQDKVVDYMNAMGSVQWTPATDLVYTAPNGTDQTFTVGTTYTGLPYNAHNGSLERFLSVMASQDANGVYTAQSDLESGGWIADTVVKNYIRLYSKEDSTTGALTGYLNKTASVPTEVITFNTANNTLCYNDGTNTYYLGATSSNETLHVTGTSVSQLPAHLYTISSSGKASIVSSPSAGTAYKLGVKNSAGTFLYFDGLVATANGVPYMSVTTDVAESVDVYLEAVTGGYHLYFETSGAWTDYGFYLTMGNDCSGAINWAWMQVSNVFAEDETTYISPYLGGVYLRTTPLMIPNDTNRVKYGVYPVGSWEASVQTGTDSAGGEIRVSAEYDASKAAYSCTDETYSPAVLNANGIDTILEAYAQAHKADVLVCYVSSWSTGNPGPGGHARLVAADPVVIRNADGTIDSSASYILETEQGASFGKTSTWNVEKKLTFYNLTGSATTDEVTLNTKVYLPITIRALHEDYIRPTRVVEVSSTPVNSPVEGRIYSYNHINSVTVTVMNGSGTVLYQHEAFSGISTDSSSYRGRNNLLSMADLHADAFYTAADGLLRAGRTYYFSVDVLLSTGETVQLVDNRAFTYTAQ